jgi:hypothetical protein
VKNLCIPVIQTGRLKIHANADAQRLLQGFERNTMSKETIYVIAMLELVVSLTAAGLAWHWYGWHAAVIVFLVLWAANLRQVMKG